MFKYTSLIFLLLLPLIGNSEIYKWVDENGVTHFGSMPGNKKYEKLAIEEKQTKPIPEGAEELAESLILKGHGDSKKVNCSIAVSNSISGINTMISVGKKNLRGGYISRSEYNKVVKRLNKIKTEISISKCKKAKGNELKFYKCVTNKYNHVAHCGDKHMSKNSKR